MSEYTDKILKIKAEWDYLESAEALDCLEAANGKITLHFKHGGARITFLREQEYEGKTYHKDDIIELPPTDAVYIELCKKYKSNALINKIKDWYNNYVRH